MHTLLFLGQMIGPISRPISIAPDGAEFHNRFGTGEAPPRARDIKPIFHQMATGAFNDAGRNGPSPRQGRGVV